MKEAENARVWLKMSLSFRTRCYHRPQKVYEKRMDQILVKITGFGHTT